MYEICEKQDLISKKEALKELQNMSKRKVLKKAGYQVRTQK